MDKSQLGARAADAASLPDPESIKYRDNRTIDYRAHAQG